VKQDCKATLHFRNIVAALTAAKRKHERKGLRRVEQFYLLACSRVGVSKKQALIEALKQLVVYLEKQRKSVERASGFIDRTIFFHVATQDTAAQ